LAAIPPKDLKDGGFDRRTIADGRPVEG